MPPFQWRKSRKLTGSPVPNLLCHFKPAVCPCSHCYLLPHGSLLTALPVSATSDFTQAPAGTFPEPHCGGTVVEAAVAWGAVCPACLHWRQAPKKCKRASHAHIPSKLNWDKIRTPKCEKPFVKMQRQSLYAPR